MEIWAKYPPENAQHCPNIKPTLDDQRGEDIVYSSSTNHERRHDLKTKAVENKTISIIPHLNSGSTPMRSDVGCHHLPSLE
jgi:hypothetical protein